MTGPAAPVPPEPRRLLLGRTALVTGAGSGIGAAIATAYATEGARLCLADRSTGPGLTEVADRCRELGVEVLTVHADVAVEADVQRLFETVARELGIIDVLVNNAGILNNQPVVEMPAGVFDEMVAVNLRSVFLCCRAVLPGMTTLGFGRIINVASQLALKGAPGLAHYSAAKAGVIGFSRALAREVASDGITVNCIAPGPVRTPLWGNPPEAEVEAVRLDLPLHRVGRPAEVAPTAVLLASDPGGNLYTGQTLGPNSGDVMP